MSISSSCNKSVETRAIAETFYNLLKQLAASLLIIHTCNRLVVNKLSQAMRTHPDIGLLLTSLLQDVNRLVETCGFLVVAIYWIAPGYLTLSVHRSLVVKILVANILGFIVL